MGDLISRSDLINKINAYCTGSQDVDFIRNMVKDMPTAYNVEKVVAELEKTRMIFFLTIANTRNDELDFAYKNVCTALDKAIDIVKAGGVDD